MKIRNSYITVSFYTGVFIVAYAGFFYQEYASRNSNVINEFTARLSSPALKRTASADKEPAAALDDDKQQTAAVGPQQRPESEQSIDPVRSVSADAHRLHEKQAFVSRGYAIALAEIDQNSNRHTGYRQGYTRPTAVESGTIEPSDTGLTLTGTTLAASDLVAAVADTVPTPAATSFPPASALSTELLRSDSTVSTSPGTGEQEQVDADHAPIYEIAEQPWPKPGCPMELEPGSTGSDAKLMQQTYGCRYLQYCELLNDGSGEHRCWWGFYS